MCLNCELSHVLISKQEKKGRVRITFAVHSLCEALVTVYPIIMQRAFHVLLHERPLLSVMTYVIRPQRSEVTRPR